MDVTREIQIAVARADMLICRARAALPLLILAAALAAAAVLTTKRR